LTAEKQGSKKRVRRVGGLTVIWLEGYTGLWRPGGKSKKVKLRFLLVKEVALNSIFWRF
jgi:hypothetical protein